MRPKYIHILVKSPSMPHGGKFIMDNISRKEYKRYIINTEESLAHSAYLSSIINNDCVIVLKDDGMIYYIFINDIKSYNTMKDILRDNFYSYSTILQNIEKFDYEVMDY